MSLPIKGVHLREKALKMVREMPKIALDNLKPNRDLNKRPKHRRGQHGGNYCGHGHKTDKYLPVLGWEHGMPFHERVPSEPYNKDYFKRREYPPFSLLQLQRCIDLARIDTAKPIDLATICNARSRDFLLDVANRHYGIQLTDEGADCFSAKVNLEVQHVNSEVVIAAVERLGGTITTRFFDPPSLFALRDAEKFFLKGIPIPRCALPPEDAVPYYIDPKNRGYLADPKDIAQARLELSQKYGYRLPDLMSENDSRERDMLMERKDARQVFYGLWPGWVINMHDKVIIKPKDEELLEFYAS